MKLIDWLKKWKLDSLQINAVYLQAELSFSNVDKKAAWELYIELLTRVATQHLAPNHGDEKTALDSIYSLFGLTRTIIKKYGAEAFEFSKIAIVVLNQVIRPFTAKWHKLSLAGAFQDPEQSAVFREELNELQQNLRAYTRLLSDMAGVEDLTDLESL
jgi:hypothetical protein